MDCSGCKDNQLEIICTACDKAFCQECAASHNQPGHTLLSVREYIQELIEDKNKKLEKYLPIKDQLKVALKNLEENQEPSEEVKREGMERCYKKIRHAFKRLKKCKDRSRGYIDNPIDFVKEIKKIKTEFKVPEMQEVKEDAKKDASSRLIYTSILLGEEKPKSISDVTIEKNYKKLKKGHKKKKEQIEKHSAKNTESKEQTEYLMVILLVI
jgi:hypothetical protein